MKAYGKNIRISPKKLRVVAELLRNKEATWALNFLKFAPKKGADLLYKVLHSAIANATNNNSQDASKLYIDQLVITKGIVYKRGQHISRGRMHPILKRTSNIRLELQVK
ncbi:50S ribosomal protein L22 [Candidatus Gracilibacteria bacterium]|nr:50S ribosomal protein L22 [Candidatus Gracilibacteria bacterium]